MDTQLLLDIFALPDDAAWQTRAACADTDPEVFMGDGDEFRAFLICRRCPVQETCLQYALDNDERYGIWGGLNQRERDRLRGFSTRAPRPDDGHDQSDRSI